jgi:hypothetical protein
MRSDQNQADRDQSLENLNEKRADFSEGMFLAIAEEEMKTRREELENRLGANSRPGAPQEPLHIRGGQDGGQRITYEAGVCGVSAVSAL